MKTNNLHQSSLNLSLQSYQIYIFPATATNTFITPASNITQIGFIFTLSDDRRSGRGSGISEGIAAGDGGNRTVYPTPRYAVFKRTGRKCGDDTVFARCDPNPAAEGTSSGDNSTWDDGSAWKREGAAGRSQCRDAESFTGKEPEAVWALWQQDLYRWRGSRMSRMYGETSSKCWIWAGDRAWGCSVESNGFSVKNY